MLDLIQLRDCVVAPALQKIGNWSKASERLVIGTGLIESGYQALKQKGGPAAGFWQMEPFTHNDLWKSYLGPRPVLGSLVEELCVPNQDKTDQLTWNLRYAAAMCRVKYLSSPQRLPHEDDLEGLGAAWKNIYNTALGAGVAAVFVELGNKYGLMNL